MTREQCIADLKGSMELFLFDPSTGETTTPDRLNETDRMTYDAMAYAADFLQTHPRTGKKSYFYTFGSDPAYPYGRDDYVEVHADDERHANQKFKDRFPNREGSTFLNCAGIYTEEAWETVGAEYYSGIKPTLVIE